jgi:hypothetical protein
MQRTQASKETQDLIRSSLPQRKIRLRWGSHKARAFTKSLFASPIPTKEDWCSLRILHQGQGNTNDIGAPHQEGTQRETHNHLEASFKSNKRELMHIDASSALEMREFKGALKASLSHTRKHSSNQTVAQRNQVWALGGRGEVEWMLKCVFVPWLVSNEWGRGEGLFILKPEN